jgi:DNA polymerase elongation subunit (family B)
MLEHFTNKANRNICGHNAREFDFPFIARRMLIHGVKLPAILDVAGKKPWEVRFLDTLDLWKFGDYKHYTSLNLLTTIFNIPSPKDDIDGSQVASVFYEEKDIERIARYCEKDVLATAQLFLRFKGEPLIDEEAVELAN